jgi:Zn-dependent protease
MHGYASYLLGDTTAKDRGRLSLNPLNHIDPFMTVILPIITMIAFQQPLLAARPVPFNPDRLKFDEFGAAIVAAVGPLSNLVLAVIAALLFNATGASQITLQSFLDIFAVTNVAIFVFNLIPIPPLDGSRVLYAFAPEPLQALMRDIEPYGLFIVLGLILVGGLGFLSNIDQSIINHLP